MDHETEQMLLWVNTEIETFGQTIEKIQAHLFELYQLRAELLNSNAEHSVGTCH